MMTPMESHEPLPDPTSEEMLADSVDLHQFISDAIKKGEHYVRCNKVDRARYWFRAAADWGGVDAMNLLASLEQNQGDLDAARHWYQRAIAITDDTEPLLELARLEQEEGNLEAARSWYQRGAEAGDCYCMEELGDLEREAGNPRSASTWYSRAMLAEDDWAIHLLAEVELELGNRHRAQLAFVLGTVSQDEHSAELLWNLDPRYDGVPGEDFDPHEEAPMPATHYENYSQAREGDRESLFALGEEAQAHGYGDIARRWWHAASAQGHRKASERLAAIPNG
jgi:exonuclease VII small subunit